MTDQLQILIVEDEAILAIDLKKQLQREGYAVVGIASTGRRAIELFAESRSAGVPVDLVLCDIHLKGDIDGIETSHRLLTERAVPLIYLTAFSDLKTLDRAKKTAPAAYLVKPVNIAQLRIAIELAISNFARPIIRPLSAPTADHPVAQPIAATERDLSRDTILQIDNAERGPQVFIKSNGKFVRINLAEVLYLEAEDIYTTLVTAHKKYALRLSLAQVLERIEYARFVRMHRSYAVNLDRIEGFTEGEVSVGGRELPIGRSYRETFISRFTFR